MGRNQPKRQQVFIGIDNGATGSIGVITIGGSYEFFMGKEYTISTQNYQKVKKNVTRIDYFALSELLESYSSEQVQVMIERPLVNPGRFLPSLSAVRAMEATLIILESLRFGYSFIDSKEWQRAILPKGSKGPQLKTDSINVGKRLFPEHQEKYHKQKDADGMLMAEYCRRYHFGLL